MAFAQRARGGQARRRRNNDEEGERERERGSEKDGLEREGEASTAEREAHLIRVQGTNYFPILWPAKI